MEVHGGANVASFENAVAATHRGWSNCLYCHLSSAPRPVERGMRSEVSDFHATDHRAARNTQQIREPWTVAGVVTVLIGVILGFIPSPLLGSIAVLSTGIVLAHVGLRRTKLHSSRRRGVAIAAIVIGYWWLAFTIGSVLIMAFVFAAGSIAA